MPKRGRSNSSTSSCSGRSSKRRRGSFELVPSLRATKPGAVFVTGAGDVGQLGLGSDVIEKYRFTLIQINQEIVDICAGGMHTVCLTKAGAVLTFGCNDEGALGRITSDDSEFTPGEVELPGEAVQISAGDSHTAALLKDGRVFIWGTFRDSHGNMGLTERGNEKLPYELLPGVEVVKIASGADHVVLLTNKGQVYTCGCGEQGQLGRTSERSCGRNARCTGGASQLGKLLSPSPIHVKPSLKLHFEDIWAGTYTTYVKTAGKNQIYVFGLNNYNQIGLKKTVPQFCPTVSADFCKYKWKLISGAQHHSLAVDENGKAYVIGRKEYGRLGLGKDALDADTLTEITSLKDENIVHVSCGSATSFAVTEKGDLYGWGMGTVGQLGTGNDEDCLEPTLIKSNALSDRQVLRVSSGGQHTVILATLNNNNEANLNSINHTLND